MMQGWMRVYVLREFMIWKIIEDCENAGWRVGFLKYVLMVHTRKIDSCGN